MKNENFVLIKLLLTLIVVLCLNLAFFLIPLNTNAISDGGYNNHLSYENFQLRKKYNELNNKLVEIERKFSNINNCDVYIYSKLLGFDIDTNSLNFYEMDSNFTKMNSDTIMGSLDYKMIVVSNLLSEKSNKFSNIIGEINNNKSRINFYPAISPIKSYDFLGLSSGFGWRKHPVFKTPIYHNGIDIIAKYGTNVYSTVDGYVEKIMYSNYGYGNRILIKNSYGYEILYAHLSIIHVKKGSRVKRGELIGKVGSTGTSTGSHLHYEITKNNKLVNPLSCFYTPQILNQILKTKI
jgi:hypothetical protein